MSRRQQPGCGVTVLLLVLSAVALWLVLEHTAPDVYANLKSWFKLSSW